MISTPAAAARGARARGFSTLTRARNILENMEDTAFEGRPETESRAAWDKWLREADEQLRKFDP